MGAKTLTDLASSPSGGAPLFRLLDKLCKRTSITIATKQSFSE